MIVHFPFVEGVFGCLSFGVNRLSFWRVCAFRGNTTDWAKRAQVGPWRPVKCCKTLLLFAKDGRFARIRTARSRTDNPLGEMVINGKIERKGIIEQVHKERLLIKSTQQNGSVKRRTMRKRRDRRDPAHRQVAPMWRVSAARHRRQRRQRRQHLVQVLYLRQYLA